MPSKSFAISIAKYAKVGNCSSYCRCVESKKISSGKQKGEKNTAVIWPGHIWKQPTMPFDATRQANIFFQLKTA